MDSFTTPTTSPFMALARLFKTSVVHVGENRLFSVDKTKYHTSTRHEHFGLCVVKVEGLVAKLHRFVDPLQQGGVTGNEWLF